MSETKVVKDAWLNWLALATVLVSSTATFSTFKGGGMSTKAVIAQSMASDKWSHYQSKSIKENLVSVELDQMTLEAIEAKGVKAQEIQKRIEICHQKIEKYEGEKKEIEAEAHQFEETKKSAQAIGAVFGNATLFLQMGIIFFALAGLLKKKPLWFGGMAIGSVGLFYFFKALELLSLAKGL